ncbi:MAG: DUF402 domain-containing protein, partial [Candidatus Lokiarchaeota archaeon]|nr:DUF402 domain-containing protein [Candidatus Lokiarchaeota archaeon]
NSISKGIVFQSNKSKNYSLVRLKPETSDDDRDSELKSHYSTTVGKLNRYLRVGTEDIFQVAFEDVGRNYAYLNQGYTVSGELAVIMPYNKRGFISKKIRDKETRKKLKGVINKVSVDDFGILIRTAAKYASEIEILREIQKLRDRYLKIESKINQSKSTIGQIISEYVSTNYLLPSTSKLKMDKIRSQIVPTVALHHSIKAAPYSNNTLHMKVLNLIESVVNETGMLDFNQAINDKFIRFYYNNLYAPRQFLNIYHNKINGRNITLRPGILKKIERDRSVPNALKIILRRNLTGHGLYDGLNIPIEKNDYAISVFTSGNMYYETIYYSKNNELKGRYFNINTPLFLSSNGIHYNDLEIDVIEPLNKPREIIDKGLLDKAFELNLISEQLYNKSIDTAEKLRSGEILSELDKKNRRSRLYRKREKQDTEKMEKDQKEDDKETGSDSEEE